MTQTTACYYSNQRGIEPNRAKYTKKQSKHCGISAKITSIQSQKVYQWPICDKVEQKFTNYEEENDTFYTK